MDVKQTMEQMNRPLTSEEISTLVNGLNALVADDAMIIPAFRALLLRAIRVPEKFETAQYNAAAVAQSMAELFTMRGDCAVPRTFLGSSMAFGKLPEPHKQHALNAFNMVVLLAMAGDGKLQMSRIVYVEAMLAAALTILGGGAPYGSAELGRGLMVLQTVASAVLDRYTQRQENALRAAALAHHVVDTSKKN